MNVDDLIRAIESHPLYYGQAVSWRRTPAQPGRYAAPDPPLARDLAAALAGSGIVDLYEHQAASLEAIRRGQNVVIETPTASGKSLCFHLPVLEGLAGDPRARALYLFPTKALARDQLGRIAALAPGIPAGVYDADTPRPERHRLRDEARLLLTNPDLLHLGILPYHLNWDSFFAGLRYVVVDEIHAYRGVFGTHVGHVLRRLRRIAAAHGSCPQFILASATIANPAGHAELLTGVPVNLIRCDGAPRGERTFALWDAYRPRPRTSLAQAAYLEDAVWLLALLLRRNVRTIVFTRSRQVAEWLLIYLERYLEASGASELMARIRPYRGGYLPEERRAIEKALFAGDLLGVVSTSALELGVDIGGLEAAIILGFPGTMSSLWQQAGRAGRGGHPALCLFIPGQNLLERYLLQHPDYFFGRPYEEALIDPANPYILLAHLEAAAFEWPLSRTDAGLWGEIGLGLAELMASEGTLTANQMEGRWYYAGAGYPAERTSLRGSGGQYRLVAEGRTIGTIDAVGAFSQAHPDAVYLHAGQSFVVEAVEIERAEIRLVPAKVDYFTEAKETTSVAIIQAQQETAVGQARACFGELQAVTQVVGYRRRQAATGAVLDNHRLDLPPSEVRTTGLWLVFPDGLLQRLRFAGLDPAGGLHGLEHLLIGLLPLTVLCDRWDVAGTSTLFHPDAGGPAIFIYDAAAGGLGFAERAYGQLGAFLARAGEALSACPCARGCPSCIQSPKCGNFNQPLDKKATEEILSWMQNES